jgi:hypothetical protein
MQLDGNDEDADEDEGEQQNPADDAAGILGEEIESDKDEDERMDEDDEEQDNLNAGDGSNIPEQEEPPSNPLEQEKKPDLQKKKSKKQNKQPLTHGIHDEAGDDRILNQPLAEDEQAEQDEEKKEAGAGGDEQEAEEEEKQVERDNSSAPSQPQQKDRNQKSSSSSSSASGGDDKSKDNKNQSESQDQSSSVQKKQKPQHQPHEKNPFLQMGDIEKDWHRRLSLVDESDDERDGNLHQEDQDDGKEPEQKGKQEAYEFAKQEDSSKNLSQVLAGSDKDTAKQLPQSGEIPDMNEDERNKHGDAQEDADQEESPRNLFDENDERLPKESSKPTYRESTPKEPDANEDKVNEERKRDRDESSSAPSQPQRKKRRTADDQATTMDVDGAESSPEHSEDEEGEDEGERKPLEKKAHAREEGKSPAEPLALTQKPMHTSQQFVFGAKSPHADGDWDSDSLQQIVTTACASAALSSLAPAAATLARQRWQNYRTQTEAHALRLSETLRLILAPTLATRLQGDYRTGKRINMRKVIPYIASGYRKDKIWLRRTKPAKRAYQIMLMIDDSRSMGQSTAGQLAMSSLALLSTALVRLEVGELCIASFAKELNVIHPFGRPFTEDVGTQIAAHFQFEAEETNVSQSLESTLPVFQTAKESLLTSSASASSDTAVLQICFLMSDARVDSDNRQRLEHIIRTMSEQHILVVLVIIDCNQDARDSIFQTKSIKFTPDQQIITSHYFDDFPFPYYVAIQEVGKLPDVLADALKQWFELIKLQLSNQASGA